MAEDDTQQPFWNVDLGAVFGSESAVFVKLSDDEAAAFRKLSNGSADFEPAIKFDPGQTVKIHEDIWLAE